MFKLDEAECVENIYNREPSPPPEFLCSGQVWSQLCFPLKKSLLGALLLSSYA